MTAYSVILYLRVDQGANSDISDLVILCYNSCIIVERNHLTGGQIDYFSSISDHY